MKFHNKEMQKIYEESQGVVDEHIANLEKLSDDIKAAEEILKVLGVQVVIGDDEKIAFGIDTGRILYLKDGESVNYLGSTKINVRMRMAKYLPDLMRKAFDLVKLSG